MQPTLTHVPPTVPFSMRATRAPSEVARIAAANAALPAPITARSWSKVSTFLSLLVVHERSPLHDAEIGPFLQ